MKEAVNHPDHYGGKDNPYEAIKVIEAWDLGFHPGNAVKYIARCGKKTPDPLEDLKKAKWYIDRAIQLLEGENKFDIHVGLRGNRISADDLKNAMDEKSKSLFK